MLKVRCIMVLMVFALINWTQSAFAGIQPSFRLDECSWNATDIVVVSSGKNIDAFVNVLESWNGDLKKTDRLMIPEMAAFAPEQARATSKKRFIADDDPNRPAHVTCSRMVLFVIKKSDKNANGKSVWTPASVFERMHVSIAWIEK